MAEVHQDAKDSHAGWDRECLQAARERNSRRLGDRSAHRVQTGSAMRNHKTPRPVSVDGDDIVILEYWKPSPGDKPGRGR